MAHDICCIRCSDSQGELLDPETNPLKKFKDNKT
jgi:hypothetical protein